MHVSERKWSIKWPQCLLHILSSAMKSECWSNGQNQRFWYSSAKQYFSQTMPQSESIRTLTHVQYTHLLQITCYPHFHSELEYFCHFYQHSLLKLATIPDLAGFNKILSFLSIGSLDLGQADRWLHAWWWSHQSAGAWYRRPRSYRWRIESRCENLFPRHPTRFIFHL